MYNSNLIVENTSFSDADFVSLVKDVLSSLLGNVQILSVDMSMVLGASAVVIGGLLMLLFASHNSSGSDDSPLFDGIEDRLNAALDKAKAEAGEDGHDAEKEQIKERQEREREERENREKEEKNREKERKQEEKRLEEEQAKKKEKENESEREKEGVSKTGDASLMGKKNTAERLAEANDIFKRIVDAMVAGKKDNDINHLFDALAKTGKDNEFTGMIEAAKLYLKENPSKEGQNINLRTISNWFEKEADIVERTASHMKDGPKRIDILEKASDFYMNAAEFQMVQNSTKAITNFEKALNLDIRNNEKLVRYGDACITFDRLDKAEYVSAQLIHNLEENVTRRNVSSCLVFCDKMYDHNMEESAFKMKQDIKEILKDNGILIPSNTNSQDQRSHIMSLVKDYQKEVEEKEA
ncbi:MAG: hypothetical protein AB7U85_08135 [Alphaproteobacteria bacterium]